MEQPRIWHAFNEGSTIGQTGSEGVILSDEEHDGSARITLEHGSGRIPFTITCGIYGWMVHTRFFSTEVEARRACAEMKMALAEIADRVPCVDDPQGDVKMRIVEQEIGQFVERFP